MRSILRYSIFIAFILVLQLLPAFAQPPATVAGNCNQPMPDPITHIKIENGDPWHAVASPDGCWIFVRTGGPLGGLVVLQRNGGIVQPFRFVKAGQNNAPGSVNSLSPTGKTLIVSKDREIEFFDVQKLTSQREDPIVGSIEDKHFRGPNGVITSDEKRLFATQHTTAWLSAMDVTEAQDHSFSRATISGGIALDTNPATPVLSPDERYLYVPSFDSADNSWPLVCRDPAAASTAATLREGSVQVVDIRNPKLPVVVTLKAGCSTRRVIVSPDGNTIFATAAWDNAVLAFDVRPLRNGSTPVLIGKVPVGPTPIGIAVFDGGKKLVVANSNANSTGPDKSASLSVIDTARIPSGAEAILGTIPAGEDARNVSVTADGRTLLVANGGSGTLELVDLERLKMEPRKQSVGQAALPSAACNQPMPDTVTLFKMEFNPWDTVATRDGCWLFVIADDGRNMAVLRRANGTLSPFRIIPLEQRDNIFRGLTLTHDEKTLILSTASKSVFFDVDKLTSDKDTDPILGAIGDRRFSGASFAAATPDDKHLFLTNHGTEWLSIVDLGKARTSGYGETAVIAGLPMGSGPLVPAMSPDGKYLYVPNEAAPPALKWANDCATDSVQNPQGTIMVVDVQRAVSRAESSVIASVPAGCRTVRVAVSPDGNTIYTTAARGDALLAFDTRPLRSGGSLIPIGSVPVGKPIGVAVIEDGRKVVVVNSGAAATVTVIDTAGIASGAGAILGTIPVGTDPRNLWVTADGRTLFVSSASAELAVIDLERVKPQPVVK